MRREKLSLQRQEKPNSNSTKHKQQAEWPEQEQEQYENKDRNNEKNKGKKQEQDNNGSDRNKSKHKIYVQLPPGTTTKITKWTWTITIQLYWGIGGTGKVSKKLLDYRGSIEVQVLCSLCVRQIHLGSTSRQWGVLFQVCRLGKSIHFFGMQIQQFLIKYDQFISINCATSN